MIIYYPTYYLVPVAPVMFLYEDEYNVRHIDEDSVGYNDEYRFRCNIEENDVYNTYRNEDIFYEVDEEYVNDNIK